MVYFKKKGVSDRPNRNKTTLTQPDTTPESFPSNGPAAEAKLLPLHELHPSEDHTGGRPSLCIKYH